MEGLLDEGDSKMLTKALRKPLPPLLLVKRHDDMASVPRYVR